MKKIVHNLIALFLFLFVFQCPIHADTGPKPSVTIHFKGIDDTYYVTLLSSVEEYGPNTTYTDEELEDFENKELLIKFNRYEDDYYFYGVVEECSKSNKFKWGYWPPETFKVLIYLPDSDTFIISDVCERYAFNSYYTIDIENNEIVDCYKSYNYLEEIISFLGRVVLTIFIELIIAEIFNLKDKKHRQIILYTNLVTQVLLNFFISYVTYMHGYNSYMLYYLWLEILIFISEGFIYKKLIKDVPNKFSPFKYSLFANITSFITGFIILKIFTLLF